MNTEDLAKLLTGLGCPPEKSTEMAAQLDKRAHQLAAQKNRTYEESLTHLLKLMGQGWSAQPSLARDRTLGVPQSEIPNPKSEIGGLRPWETRSSKRVGDFRIFTLRSDEKTSPRTGKTHDFFVIDSVNWVNVVALTPDHKIVLVEQYRHGSNTVELEIPGGMMDAHDASPVVAGRRELREETGYEGEPAQIIGEIFPNPAIMSNTCYTLLVENCRVTGPVQFDGSEDLITHLVPVAEIPELVAGGKIRHALVVVALYHFELWRKKR